MYKYIALFVILLSWNSASWAQTTDGAATELNSAPPALPDNTPPPATTEAPNRAPEVKPLRKMSFGLSAGTQFSRLFGTATYLEPQVIFPVTKRFSGFASLSMITTFNPNRSFFGSQEPAGNYAPLRNQQYIMHAGGNYLVNDRLNLTGSIWRDLSRNALSAPVNLLMPGGTNGMSFRAHYKLTDNISVSGGFRYSNGNAYQNNWFNPASPYGY